ncbi:precorrin-3B C(17)-methyltransferase [Methanocella sp. CWC-04]|uniref:Precorrin-3B C(17)-methyltransferase n=1 Tax=Methanooceanicella nereidis TaxID=2052831 RepID=A0AAP2RD84_9EURY|nr:precorrin-3B C(17)-methyltransferase [Methanocella sp. CWC-04]MCD1295399.1 precorrin-3B C(17)-methyltransferase [Methanocella sp. CWC-04]
MEKSPSLSQDKGRLYIVGTGPGDIDHMTPAAIGAIKESDYVIGNSLYIEMLEPLLEGKEVIKSTMGEEIDRAKKAAELSKSAVVSIVSGGDPGVYGMAGIVLEMLERTGYEANVEVIPGVTAATAAASLLGSPLSGDHVTISLSNLLTPWEVIEKRLELAFSMGVPVAIYNPKSRGRPHNFGIAMDIALKKLSPDTPVGIVKDAYRDGEQLIITKLGDISMDDEAVDMHSIVIVGGEESRIWRSVNAERIITPRGYHRKYIY